MRASMLLVSDRATGKPPVADMIGPLLRQLGLLADAASSGAADEGIGTAVALLFGDTAVALTMGDGADGPPTDGMANPSVMPIGQGVAASPIAAAEAWLRLDVTVAPGDDRMLVAQRLCSLSALLAARLPVTRLCWLPNQLWTDSRPLADAVIAVERQGLPPVMHLIGFLPGADGSVTTRGLDWFGLQDMRISAPTGLPVADLVRRLARLAAEQLAVRAPLRRGRYPGIERGEWVSIEPADTSVGRLLCEAVVEPAPRR
jgi:hypothetical protein